MVKEGRYSETIEEKEVKYLVCKECGCTISLSLCNYGCKYDSDFEDERPIESMEYKVYKYKYNRSEPYIRPQ